MSADPPTDCTESPARWLRPGRMVLVMLGVLCLCGIGKMMLDAHDRQALADAGLQIKDLSSPWGRAYDQKDWQELFDRGNWQCWWGAERPWLEPSSQDLLRVSKLRNFEAVAPVLKRARIDMVFLEQWPVGCGIGGLVPPPFDGCPALESLDGLQGLDLLELRIVNCHGLRDLEAIRGMSHLAVILLDECRELRDLDALCSLPVLKEFYLTGCEKLENIEALRRQKLLERLQIYGPAGAGIVDWSPLGGLAALDQLELMDITNLRSVEWISGLSNLHDVSFYGCGQLESLDGLQYLSKLETLDVSGCEQLHDLDPLRGLPALKIVDARECSALESVEGLRANDRLVELNLGGCRALTSVEGLRGLLGLKHINLNHCENLEDIQALRDCPALESLAIESCPKLDPAAVEALRKDRPGLSISYSVPDPPSDSGDPFAPPP